MKQPRLTIQKKMMRREIKSFNNFFSAEDFFKRVASKDRKIGIATVYRFLKNLREMNKLYAYVCDRRFVYSRKKVSHCHFICEETGKVIHFDVDSLDFLKDKIPGEIRSFQLEVRGSCNECRSKSFPK